MATHEHYYVPAQSKWPIIATVGMFITMYGLGTWFIDMKAGRESHGPIFFAIGGLVVAYIMFGWFGTLQRHGDHRSPRIEERPSGRAETLAGADHLAGSRILDAASHGVPRGLHRTGPDFGVGHLWRDLLHA
nr:hypothetical protein [Tanacetum cinerariifolium]